MANKRREPVNYRPFKPNITMADGLLPVARPDLSGDIERRASEGWFRVTDIAGKYADRQAAIYGERAGREAAIAGAPKAASITGDAGTGYPVPDNAARPFKTKDPVAKDLKPYQKAFLNAVAGGESAGQYNIRYTPSGGAVFNNLSQHPRMFEPTKEGKKSSAAGRYQFTATTWDDFGGGNFSPENQDRRAWQLAMRDYTKQTGRDLDADLQAEGLTTRILAALAPTWQAFTTNRDRHIATYNDSLQRYSAAPADNVDPVATASVSKEEQARLAVGVPGIVPVTVKPGKAGAFRPNSRDTVYGRAYDVSGMRTYLQMLDTTVRTDIINAYDAAKDNPAEFEEKLAALKKTHLDDHVFPEIRPEYEQTFAQVSLPLLRQAKLDQKKRLDQQNRADFLERTTTLETDVQRSMAALSPDNPDTVSALWQTQSSLDDHYDAAVLHGVLSPQQAAQAKIVSQRKTAVEYYLKQAEGKSVADIRQMRQEMEKDFAAGNLPHIDGDGWSLLETHLQRLENNQTSNNRAANAEYARRGATLLEKVEAGFDIDPAELSKFTLDMNTSPKGIEIHNETFAKMQIGMKIRDMKPGEAEQYVRDLRTDIGRKPTDEQVVRLMYAEKSLETKRKILALDPLSYAEKLQIIPAATSLADSQTPADLVAAMRGRVDAGNLVADYFGITPRFLKPGEAEAISKIVTANPEAGAALAGAIVEGAGESVNAVLAEFGAAAPQIWQAGAILADDGSSQAAMDVLAGYGKNEDGKPYKPVPVEIRQQQNESVYDNALSLVPAAEQRIRQAAAAIAKKRIYEQGIDPASDEAATVYADALLAAASGVKTSDGTFGGFVKVRKGWFGRGGTAVLVDPQIRADRFEDILGAVKMTDFANAAIKPVRADGRPLPEGYFSSVYPVAVSGGYLFSVTDPKDPDPQWIMGSDGQPFVFDPRQYRDVLSVRVPGAFR